MDAARSALNKINTDPVAHYRWYGIAVFADSGEGWQVRESRQRLFEAGIDNDDTREIDEIVIEAVMVSDYVSQNVVADDDAHSLSHWWWHLGKIRKKSFPAEQLPEPLRAVYLDTQNT